MVVKHAALRLVEHYSCILRLSSTHGAICTVHATAAGLHPKGHITKLTAGARVAHTWRELGASAAPPFVLELNATLAILAAPLTRDCSFEKGGGGTASDPGLSSVASWRRVKVLAAETGLETGRETGLEFVREFSVEGPREREC